MAKKERQSDVDDLPHKLAIDLLRLCHDIQLTVFASLLPHGYVFVCKELEKIWAVSPLVVGMRRRAGHKV